METEENKENIKQETETIKLTKEQIAILKKLDNAPIISKNIYYLCGQYSRAYEYMYKKIKVLESLGAVYKYKSDAGRVSYIPAKDIMTAIYEREKIEVKTEGV
jgi:hypothetical protein